jgi:putative endonuclease
MSFYTYILYSKSKDRYYIGSCSDLSQRLKRHNDGATPSTKPGRPWIVVWSISFATKTEALKKENYLKRMKSRVLIEKLISESKSGS